VSDAISVDYLYQFDSTNVNGNMLCSGMLQLFCLPYCLVFSAVDERVARTIMILSVEEEKSDVLVLVKVELMWGAGANRGKGKDPKSNLTYV